MEHNKLSVIFVTGSGDKRHVSLMTSILYIFPTKWNIFLNDKPQGEGGTLRFIKVNYNQNSQAVKDLNE
ncbi:MAG TPA: hypothetical protein DCY42_09000 [Chloroflexi bacterium]|nr:hypothetical protein [Chloroflexota bacterium]